MGSPCSWDCPQKATGNPNQVTLDGAGLGDNSRAHVTPKQQKDWGTSWEISDGIKKIQHPYYCRQPHPNPSCCPWGEPSTHGGAQHPQASHTDLHSPLNYGSVHPSCRDISPFANKAIAFLANIDSSLFPVNIYAHLNKKLLLQPGGKSQRPCNKRIRSWLHFQQRTCFHCSWLQLGAATTVRGSTGLPISPTPPTWHLWAGVGESHMLIEEEKLLDQSPQHRQPQA